jgi:hypothetical protein
MASIQAGIQSFLDEERAIDLILFHDLTSDGVHRAQSGPGVVTDVDTYRFDPTSTLNEVTVDLEGDTFESGEHDVALQFDFFGNNIDVPVREAVLTGTFTTAERCSIGEQLTEEIPTTWRTGGRLFGKISVEEAEETDIVFGTTTRSLCDFLSGDVLQSGCDAEPDAWTNGPDTDIDGEPAWLLDVGYAATAVNLLP